MGSEYLERKGIPNSRKSISHSDPDLGLKLMNQGDLDSSPLLKGLPISLARIDIHAEWVSPAILTLLGDLPDTIDGGEIVRDESGKPTGVFVRPYDLQC
jgi:predicted amidohydrolase YtcJ